ncbi:MAG: hypothetical protein V4481_01425 [Patescibacteria group bacterium]
MSLIIGLTGENGGGKGTFIDFLKHIAVGKTVERIASSQLLGETLDLWDIKRTRRALQDLAIVMDGHYGKGTLTHAVQKRIEASQADIVIFDGVRWQTDEEMILSFPQNLMVYVTSDLKIRYERTKARKEKIGEATTSFEQFLDEEKIGTELEIAKIGARADIKIEHNGSLDEYRKMIERVYRESILVQ